VEERLGQKREEPRKEEGRIDTREKRSEGNLWWANEMGREEQSRWRWMDKAESYWKEERMRVEMDCRWVLGSTREVRHSKQARC
jgi:hypothetical protein